ncbi:alpha-ribazole phosphatase [Rhodopseudomonas rhenobacensis]|uniref:Alpha-ribazole phosphatase n=1 Tax=Rhodopseudomonas rhenobacensis TaxID=87461 RepID=A0A7W7Z224_9BRAD|nr:histidine phosphatase family protein [Rhodopseudomonas rhenobacensis]MBB5046600.1 alpha-ribazole phosphatase [Rhodopseudomonas rhenobacensis]
MTETRLWLVRHAPVAGPRGVIHDGDASADTSNAEAIAALRSRLPADAACYASSSRRTLQTAAALALQPIAEPKFREQHFGAWTGRRHEDLARELGDAYTAFWRAPAVNRPPGGESFADQIVRVREGVDGLPPGDVVLVVHSGTVRAALAIALDIAPDPALRFVIDPLSLTRIDRLQGGWRVVYVNR